MTDQTWTAEDQLHLEFLRMKARSETPTSVGAVSLSIGNANLAAFSANMAYFIRRGMDITWDGSAPGLGQTHYYNFSATGDYEDMRDFWNWYRGFFHMV